MSFKVSWKIHILCFFIAYIFCLIEQKFILNLFVGLLLQNTRIEFTGNMRMDLSIFLFIIFIPITFVHELLHGIVYMMFGGKVRYGFKVIYVYAQEISDIELHRTKFLLVLLAPLTIISLCSAFMPKNIGGIVFLLNLLGSTGDILMALYLCKSNVNSYVVDRIYGFDVIDK
ncbi:DUF3267 domain-containing protein [Clostridium neonatale]|uniref:DUF3267 domain-containing protein n=1 Tax=Clostridium neonatale TaxID=137838 RepID=UPI00071E3BDB|nr:DUF3267 domain-containing protein [Clostridium neonatale]